MRPVLALTLIASLAGGCREPVRDPPPAVQGPSAAAGADVPAGAPFLADYAAEFAACDSAGTFNGRAMTGARSCRGDPNRLAGFERLPGGAIGFTSKLSLDMDGGWKACNSPGLTDLCPTTYVYPELRGRPEAEQKARWREAFVTSDTVPYVVIPVASNHPDPGQRRQEGREFRDRTGIVVGDVGVVILGERVIPVLVADGGPHNKIGEGSLALFDALGASRCRARVAGAPEFCADVLNASLDGTVRTILFPGSAIAGLTPDTVNAQVSERARALYAALGPG
jgi:hypothetical protein